jgi:hypothetical protein
MVLKLGVSHQRRGKLSCNAKAFAPARLKTNSVAERRVSAVCWVVGGGGGGKLEEEYLKCCVRD